MKTRSRAKAVVVGITTAIPALAATQLASAATTSPATTTTPTVTPTDAQSAATPFCSTRALSPQQLQDGVKSTIKCYAALTESFDAIGVHMASATSSQLAVTNDASVLLAYHYDATNGSGTSFAVSGACDGGGLSMAAGDPWNDRISSTRHYACSRIKHFADANFSGTAEWTNNSSGNASNLGVISDAVSSIRYYA